MYVGFSDTKNDVNISRDDTPFILSIEVTQIYINPCIELQVYHKSLEKNIISRWDNFVV